MIDEKRLIERIKWSLIAIKGQGIDVNHTEVIEKDKLLKIINEQPKIGEWIPCSERLPSKEESLYYDDDYDCIVNQEFIVTIEGADESTVLYYDAILEEWADEVHNGYDVIAWMPLPPAYKGE